jgi:hypothetical protein
MDLLVSSDTYTALKSQVDTAIASILAVIVTLRASRDDASITNAVLDAQTTALTAVQTTVDMMSGAVTTTVQPGTS